MNRLQILAAILVLAASFNTSYADDLADANEYFFDKQYSKAAAAYERALPTASNKAQVYNNLGVCYEKLGNMDKALANYRNAGNVSNAPAAVSRLEKQIKDRKIVRLKRDAQSAYDAMNYGRARSKAEEILGLDPANSWARNFINTINDELSLPPATDTAGTAAPETAIIQTDTVAQPDTATQPVSGEPASKPMPLWLVITIIAAVLVAAGIGGFFIGRVSKKETVKRAMYTLLRMLPAGMVSVRKDEKLSLLFFEKGKVIKAIVEEADGVKIGGRSVAEEILGTSCPYEDKPEGPWSEFAELMTDVYRHAQVEAGKSKLPSTTKRKGTRRKKK